MGEWLGVEVGDTEGKLVGEKLGIEDGPTVGASVPP